MALFKRNKKKQAAFDIAEPVMAAPVMAAPQGPSFNDLTVGDVSTGVPRIRVGEMLNSLKRQMKWLIPFLILGTFIAWFMTKDFKRSYHADGSILVQLGSEYVYDPIGTDGSSGAGLTLTPDHIVQNEIALIKNSDTISRLISEMEDQFGARFSPSNFDERSRHAVGSFGHNEALVALRDKVDRSFGVSARPKSSILSVSYRHEDPEIAVAALELVIQAYQDFRRSIFVEGSGEVLTERRVATEEQLKLNERAINKFLTSNNISDFTSERTGVTKRTEDLREALNTLRANLIENEQALASVEDQLRGTPKQIDLQVDDRASQRVAQAELELSQLLVKYLPTSEPVSRKQAEVDELRRLQSSFGGAARGGRRVGPNDVYQALLTRRNTLQSTADALREREALVQQQLNGADTKVRKLQNLNPDYQDLLRARDTLDERLKDYTRREQEALINQQQAQAQSDNVKVIDIATYARKGRNMRMLMFALGTIGWGLTLILIALMRVFLDPALYVGQQIQTRRQADQTVGRREQDYAASASLAPAAAVGVAASGYEPAAPEQAAKMHQEMHQEPVQDFAPQAWVPAQQPVYTAQPPHGAGHYEQGQDAQAWQPPQAEAYYGSAAQDFSYNPYLQSAQGAKLQPHAGIVPHSPEA